MRVAVLVVASCAPPLHVRPLDIVPRGSLSVSQHVSGLVGFEAPRRTRDGERAGDVAAVVRTGIAPRCDLGAGLSFFARLDVDVRCGLLVGRAGDPLTLTPFIHGSFGVFTAAVDSLADGFGHAIGFDIAPPPRRVTPFLGVALHTLTAIYGDRTEEQPPDGVFAPVEGRREIRLEAQLGAQLGQFRLGHFGLALAIAPYWIVSEQPSAIPDGIGLLLAASVPK